MKIALVTPRYLSKMKGGNVGGHDRYIYELLNRFRSRGVNFISVQAPPISTPLGTTIKLCFKLPIKVLNKQKKKEVTLVHAIDPIAAVSFPFVKKAKVVTCFDLSPLIFAKSGDTFYSRMLSHFYYRIAKYSDFFISISNQTKEELINFLKIPEEKIEVIPLGVDDKFVPIKKESEPQEILNIGYLGGLLPRKGVDYLIKAFYLLIKKFNIKARLFIYGEGRQYPELLKLVKRLDLMQHVTFGGHVPEEKIVKIYNFFDIFVFPSEWEGFGIPILEAQRCGVPVIVREEAHIPPEVTKYCIKVKSEEDMADKMRLLLTNKNLRNEHAKMGVVHATQFTWEKCAHETLKVYEKTINRKTKT